MSCVQTTPLMYVEVAAIVPPKQQAYIRSAGSKGADAYEEVVERGKASLYVENSHPHFEPHYHAPVILPVAKDDYVFSSSTVLVVHDEYLTARDISLGSVKVHPGQYSKRDSIRNIRYVGGPRVTTTFESWDHDVFYDKVTHIELRDFEAVTTIQRAFLGQCTSLTSINLTPFKNVTTIGDCFLEKCSSLDAVDLTPLQNVTIVGNTFLYECTSLTTIDLGPLGNVTQLGGYFLGCCTALKKVVGLDAALCNLTQIDGNFMHRCTSLAEIDLGSFVNVTIVGNAFLYGCSSLTSIDLTPFRNVEEVQNEFMGRCASLASIDVRPLLCNATMIGSYFLFGCSSLTTIIIDNSTLHQVEEIGYNFMGSCTSLGAVDLSSLHAVTMGEGMMRGCSSLRDVSLGTTCADAKLKGFMCGTAITSIDLGPLGNVSEIGSFLCGSHSLTSVDLTPLNNVTAIGDEFMTYCSSLISVDISPLGNVTKVGYMFLANCNALTAIDFSPLVNVKQVGRNCMSGCTSLVTVELGHFAKFAKTAGFLEDTHVNILK